MPLEVIYVVRHGFRTAWTVDPITGVYSSSIRTPTGIAADPPLTSHGTLQANETARHLMTLDPPIDAVYSSPYYRCLQTIAPYIELKRQQQQQRQQSGSSENHAAASSIRPEHGIAEWFGAAPFDHPRPASAEVLKPMFPAYSLDYTSTRAASSKGETLPQLYERVASALRAIVDQCDMEGHRAIVLCTHAAVVIALGRVLTGDMPETPDVEDFQAYTCGLSTYRRKGTSEEESTGEKAPPGRMNPLKSGLGETPPNVTQGKGFQLMQIVLGNWTCELNSDCSFLSHGAERGWMFSGDESFPGTGSMSQESESKL